MVGYPESMTDPSFAGQVLCFTYPLIGNYGVPSAQDKDVFGLPRYFESESGSRSAGMVVQEYCQRPSHWASTQTLSDWMADQGIPGIEGHRHAGARLDDQGEGRDDVRPRERAGGREQEGAA